MDFALPPSLPAGGTIGLIAPSSAPKAGQPEALAHALESRGYNVRIHPQVHARAGQLAGSDAQRVQAIHDVFADPAIHAVVCVRGGSGGNRLLDKIDYAMLARNPKPFVGLSDITVLLNAIARKAGFVTYHGPMFRALAGANADARSMDNMLAVLGGRDWQLDFPDVSVEREGDVIAPLWGGNITLLENLMATPWDWSADASAMMIEDVGEAVYSLDRSLQHLALAGRFADIKALIVGEMIEITDGIGRNPKAGDPPYGMSFRDIVMEKLPAGIPVAFDVPCGHGAYATTLPLGQTLKLSFSHAHGLTLKPATLL